MRLCFKDSNLRLLCNSGEKLNKKFGPATTQILKRLLISLHVSPTLADLSQSPPISRKHISNDNFYLYSVGTSGAGQVLFRPEIEHSEIDLSKINEVKILEIGATV
jgi:hypothetical protein